MRRLAGLLVVLAVTTGCDPSQYEFKVDESIDIVEPAARSTVNLPVSVRWTDDRPFTNPRVALEDPAAAYYAVFVDRPPVGPGKSLTSLIEGTVDCELSAGCPNEAQLAEQRVFLVATPSLSLEFIADLRASTRGNSKDTHEVVIVRMRGDRRVGEAAFLQTFFVRR